MHPFQFQLKEQRLRTRERLCAVDGLLDKHELAENVVDDAQMSVWVILIGTHDLGTCIAHGCRLTIDAALTGETRSDNSISGDDTSALLFLGTLFEEHFSEDVFLLAERVIVLHIVVVGLVKHAIRIVIAVRILIPDSADLAQLHMRIASALVRIFLIGRCIRIVARLARAT